MTVFTYEEVDRSLAHSAGADARLDNLPRRPGSCDPQLLRWYQDWLRGWDEEDGRLKQTTGG